MCSPPGEQGQRGGAQGDDRDAQSQDPGQQRAAQRLTTAQRTLIPGPLEVADHRNSRAEQDQRRPDNVPAPRDAGEWEQLGNRQPGDDQR